MTRTVANCGFNKFLLAALTVTVFSPNYSVILRDILANSLLVNYLMLIMPIALK